MNAYLAAVRQRLCLTQAEMAWELDVKPGTYAMIERGERKMSKVIRNKLNAFLEKYGEASRPEIASPAVPEAADLIYLRTEAGKQMDDAVKNQQAETWVQEDQLTKKLKVLKKKFEKALEVVHTADSQLLLLSEAAGHKDQIMVLKHKRARAIKVIGMIVKQQPAKIAVKIAVLKQEKLFLENAENMKAVQWLSFDAGKLLGNAEV